MNLSKLFTNLAHKPTDQAVAERHPWEPVIQEQVVRYLIKQATLRANPVEELRVSFGLEQGELHIYLKHYERFELSWQAQGKELDQLPVAELLQFFVPFGLGLIIPGLEARVNSTVQSYLQKVQVEADCAIEVHIFIPNEQAQCWLLSEMQAPRRLPVHHLIKELAA